MLAEVGFLTALLAFFAAIYSMAAILIGEVDDESDDVVIAVLIRGIIPFRFGRFLADGVSWGFVSLFGKLDKSTSERLVISGRNAAILTFPLLLISTGSLQLGLLTEEYQISYVWSVSNPSMPEFYRWTALWGSQAGSILFWSMLMSGFSVGAIVINWRKHRQLMPYTTVFMMATLAFFIALTVFIENPFDRWWLEDGGFGDVVEGVFAPSGTVAPDADRLAQTAKGLNPLLRHFGMAIHPPMLYLGFVGFIIPFAFAMGALASGDLSTAWVKASRRWTLIAWLFLSLGLILGGRWAYDVLGWGGYWGWDPVENAAFLPWLVGTAYLHSVMIQEKRGMLKVWNMFLVIGTFSAVIFGTFATRSGLVDSVHSFARSGIGFPMFFFWFSMTFISVALIVWRRQRGDLADDHAFSSLLSRESLFVVNNIIFLALFVAIFWGSFGGPIISELFLDTEITLGTDYFMRVTPPMFGALYLLMGIAPLSAWGVTSADRLSKSLLIPLGLTIGFLAILSALSEMSLMALIAYGIVSMAGFVAIYETYRGMMARWKRFGEIPPVALFMLLRRNPRRYGGYLIHVGVVIIGIGVIGSTLFQLETQQTLHVGESLYIDDYELRFDELASGQISEDGRIMDIAHMTLLRNDDDVAVVKPRRDFFPEVTSGDMNSMTIAGAHSTIENDFYVLLVGWEQIGNGQATFKVYINPLVNLVWWGGIILIIGTFAAMWPKEPLPARVRKTSPMQTRGDKRLGATI